MKMVKSLTENSNVNIFFTPHSKEPRFLFTRKASQATKYQEKHRNYIPELKIRMQVRNLFNFLQHTHTKLDRKLKEPTKYLSLFSEIENCSIQRNAQPVELQHIVHHFQLL